MLNKSHMQVVQVHLQPFRCNSLLNCLRQPEIAKKFMKNHYFRGSRSFKVIDVEPIKSLSLLLLVMMSSMSVPICNCFHATRANSSKITTF